MAEGYKKRDLQRTMQKVHTGSTISSRTLDSAEDNHRLELGFPAEKITVVTTGNLQATVTPKIGAANSNAGIAVSTTPSTTTAGNLFTAVEITWTSGSGMVLIVAK